MAPDARARIVAEARTWLGTPWVHQGRTKGTGVDCAGVLAGTCKTLALSDFDIVGYARAPDGLELKRICDAQMTPIRVAAMQPGDIVLLRFTGDPQHVAIVGDYVHGGLSIIHGNSAIGKVVEHRLTNEWRAKIVAAYRLPGVPE